MRLLTTHISYFYILCAFIFLELWFKFGTGQIFLWKDLVLIFFFQMTLSLFLYGVIRLFFKRKGQYRAFVGVLSLATIIYCSQFIYHRTFHVFYGAYSLGQAEQIFPFWRELLAILLRQALWLAIFFVPLILFIVYRRKLFTEYKMTFRSAILCIFVGILFHGAAIGFIKLGDQAMDSAYHLYFKEHRQQLAVERFGLLTAMRLDLQRHLLGWTPKQEQIDEQNVLPDLKKPPREEVTEPPAQDENDTVYEEQILPIDFSQLIATETDEEIINMHHYFSNVVPTRKNEFTGLFKGYNLILITAEAFSPWAIHPEITPTLYKMATEGFQFTNFYTPIWEVSTSDGEYVVLTGLIPKSGVWSLQESSKNSLPFSLGQKFRQIGYETRAYHNHTYHYYGRHLSHPNLGYDYKGLGNGLEVKETWPESDLEMMQVTLPEYIDHEPFHVYYMTVSGHLLYTFSGNYIAYKNKELVEHLPYSDEAKAYLATQIELDRALAYLLEQLEEAGVLERTVIALSADHYPYGLDKRTIDELAGHPVEENFELYKNVFILYTKNMEPVTIDKPASSLDILPTLLNLFGLEYDSRLLMGRDLFSDSPPLVIFLNRSFITEKGKYHGRTGNFTANEGVSVDAEYVEKMKAMVADKFYYSRKILETDYYSRLNID